MRHLLWTFAALLLIALLPRTGSLHAAERSPALQALGTEFRLILSDGSVLGSRDMVGAVLTLSSGLNIRIDAVEGDPTSAPGDVLLHSFSVRREDGSWTSLCSPGPDGRQQGFPLAGRALPDGRIVPAGDGDLEVVCTSGAQGKCVRFGYKPWLTASDGRPLRDH